MTRVNEHGQPVGEPVADWTPRERPGPVVLQGTRVRLEPLSVAHAGPVLAALAPHPQLWTYRPETPPDDLATAREWVWARVHDPLTQTYAVVRLADERLRGVCSLMRTDAANGVTELGAILLAPDVQRTSASTEMTYLVAQYVFDTLGYRRLEWKCDSLNEPSRRAAHRLGFRYEGRFRQAQVYRGRNRDTDWFSLIDSEWPSVRAAQERWLDPDNVDAQGRQRQSLSALLGRTG